MSEKSIGQSPVGNPKRKARNPREGRLQMPLTLLTVLYPLMRMTTRVRVTITAHTKMI